MTLSPSGFFDKQKDFGNDHKADIENFKTDAGTLYYVHEKPTYVLEGLIVKEKGTPIEVLEAFRLSVPFRTPVMINLQDEKKLEALYQELTLKDPVDGRPLDSNLKDMSDVLVDGGMKLTRIVRGDELDENGLPMFGESRFIARIYATT